MIPACVCPCFVEGPIGRPVFCLDCQRESATDRWASPETPIEAERELVEVGLEVLGVYAAMMGKTADITHDNEVVDTGGAGA